MSEIGDSVLQGFLFELHKLAAPWSGLGSVGAVGGTGLLGGALLGAGVGAVRNYGAAREQGATRGQAFSAGAGGALGGAGRGALIGGVAGAVGGAGLAAFSPERAEALRKTLTTTTGAGVGARFGQRQVHGLTGWRPEGTSVKSGLKELGMGSSLREGAVTEAKKELEQAQAGTRGRALSDLVMGRSATEGTAKRLAGAQKALAASEKAENMGLTNLPGYASSLRKDWKGTLGAAAGEQLSGAGLGMKALTIGLPAVSIAQEAMRDEDPMRPGQGRLRRVGRAVGNTAAGVLLGPMPMAAQMLGSEAASTLGAAPGALVDKFSRKPKVQGTVMPHVAHDLTAESGQGVPGERTVSERAAGSLGEGSPS